MTMVTAAELARALNLSRTRIGQYVAEGKLDGCFTGTGRARRFDLERSTAALRRNLHPGQLLGNGAETRKALSSLQPGAAEASPPSARWIELPQAQPDGQGWASAVPTPQGVEQPRADRQDDAVALDEYQVARASKVMEEARRLRRMNAEAEGKFVLASEVSHQTAKLIGQEIAEVEAMLREAARRIADQMGLDAKVVRKILMDEWRAKRGARAVQLDAHAEASTLSPKEQEEDI